MTLALPALGAFVIVLWVVAIALLIAVILGFVANVLHGLPYPINQLAGPVNSLASGITNACYGAIKKTEQLVGASFHQMARYLDKVWHEIERTSGFSYQSAKVLENHAHAINRLGTRQHALARVAPTIAGEIRDLRREYNGIEHQIRDLQKARTHGIGDDVLPRLKHLEREAANVRTKLNDVVIPQEKTLTGEIGNILDWAGGKASLLGIGTFAFAIASALGLNSLSGFLCKEFRNILGRGCGNLWGGLESLLSLFVDVLILSDLCNIIPEVVTFFGLVEAPLTGLISQGANAICSQPPKAWAQLDVAHGPLPPPQTLPPTSIP